MIVINTVICFLQNFYKKLFSFFAFGLAFQAYVGLEVEENVYMTTHQHPICRTDLQFNSTISSPQLWGKLVEDVNSVSVKGRITPILFKVPESQLRAPCTLAVLLQVKNGTRWKEAGGHLA